MSSASDWNQQVIEEFRANEGKVGGFFEGRNLLLLHTSGAKSGLPRLTPLVYLQSGDDIVIIASKAGAPTNPDWYYNIRANPTVSIEVGSDTYDVQAIITEEPERSQLYAKMEEIMSNFTEYREKTTRTIPVIKLLKIQN